MSHSSPELMPALLSSGPPERLQDLKRPALSEDRPAMATRWIPDG